MSTTYDPRTPAMGGRDATALLQPYPYQEPRTHRRISWAAILGGVVLVIAVQLMLSLLGAGIGFSTVDTNAGSTPTAGTLGISAGTWWVITSCIALLVGGYVAAWLAGLESRFDGLLHGIVTWGIATLLTVWLLTSAIGGLVGGGLSALGHAASAAGNGVAQAAGPLVTATGMSPDMLQQQAEAYLRPANPDPAAMNAQDAQKAIAGDLATYSAGGADAAAAKERIIGVIAAQMKISHDDAARRFDETQDRLTRARDQAVQTAKNTADASAAAASRTSFAAAAVLLLGLVAAGLGGVIAVPRGAVATVRARAA